MTLCWLVVQAAVAAGGSWAGIPLDRLPALGLGEPQLDLQADGWRAALPRGFVHVWILADEGEASRTFAFQSTAAATVSLPDVAVDGADQARGDDHVVLLRNGNVVLLVRDDAGAARSTATRLEGALVHEATPDGPTISLGGETLRFDTCGRAIRR